MDTPSSERWRKFEETGEAQVRANLAEGRYGPDNSRSAVAWLEYLSVRKVDASSSEQIAIARRAADAADEAASAAREAAETAKEAAETARLQLTTAHAANTRATVAIIIAGIAALAAIIAPFVK